MAAKIPWGDGAAVDTAAVLSAAAVRLPWMVLKYPEALQAAARFVLPSNDVRIPAAQTWAPVMAWIALRELPTPAAALALYDGLRLRHALAEVFSAVGVHGEQAWRAAAQIRALLLMNQFGSCSAAVRSAAFWDDADVRWLTGIHGETHEPEYFTQEGFESFVCWLKLPALIAIAEGPAVADQGGAGCYGGCGEPGVCGEGCWLRGASVPGCAADWGFEEAAGAGGCGLERGWGVEGSGEARQRQIPRGMTERTARAKATAEYRGLSPAPRKNARLRSR